MGKDLIYIPADFSVAINAEPLSGLTMDEYDFDVEIYSRTRTRSVKFKKSQLKRKGENSYVAPIGSAVIGAGIVNVRMIARIPDDDYDGGMREDVAEYKTDIECV